MTKRGQSYSSMGICGDTIDYLGNENPDGYDQIIDLQGKYIFPGLCDSHMHLLYTVVLAASSFNICSITEEGIKPDNIDGIEKSIRAYTSAHPTQKLIVVNQYITPAIAEHRLPTAAELDDWCDGKKAVVFSIDGHSCSLSSSMMESVGITSDSGIITGSEYDMSQGKITNYIASSVSLGTLIKGVCNFQNECFKYGISKVCDLEGDEIEGKNDLLLSLIVFLARRMDIKVRLFPQYMNYQRTAKYQKNMIHKRIGGCSKWELDGSVGSYSAAFYNPYKNGEPGPLYYDQGYINSKISEGLDGGYTMTCHAIGTKAIDQIVEAYTKSESKIPNHGPMCRIDHFEFPSESAQTFIKRHRLAITLQPGYSYLDKRYIHSYTSHLCDEDISSLCPVRDLDENGVIILGSSDSPVQSINPYDQMLGMMEYYLDDQSLDAYDALKTFTYNSSLALDEPENCLALGNKADFFICNQDITTMKSAQINQIHAEQMYINGELMVRKEGSLKDLLKLLATKPSKC